MFDHDQNRYDSMGSPLDFQRQQPLTVTQLTRSIKNTLERNFGSVWVQGEISNLALPRSGHMYFTLKDDQTQIRAVMFRSALRGLKFTPEEGLEIIVSGNITVYESRGEYQIIVSFMEPKGKGALQLAFEQLKAKLAAEGLFAPQHKKPLPPFPRTIGIVTSSTGAAIHDLLNILERRFSNVRVLLFPTKVQGKEAAPEIVEGIVTLGRRDDIDVIIIGRGGGSIEDLWPFNEEIVARAIYACPVPIISAVGHETDFTIADFVADVRAPTPSAAAELVVRNKDDLINQLRAVDQFLINAIRQKVDFYWTRLQALVQRPLYYEPERYFYQKQLGLDELRNRLGHTVGQQVADWSASFTVQAQKLALMSPIHTIDLAQSELSDRSSRLFEVLQRGLERRKQDFRHVVAKLETLSPLGQLARGYSIVLGPDQDSVIKRVADLQIDQHLRLQFHDGQACCAVEQINQTTLWGKNHEKEKNDI
ncbi:exodeoxyribonuclease VII large subunit [bacterium]|nr:exodeoxyribonuclease VII large subunit [bacterium]